MRRDASYERTPVRAKTSLVEEVAPLIDNDGECSSNAAHSDDALLVTQRRDGAPQELERDLGAKLAVAYVARRPELACAPAPACAELFII